MILLFVGVLLTIYPLAKRIYPIDLCSGNPRPCEGKYGGTVKKTRFILWIVTTATRRRYWSLLAFSIGFSPLDAFITSLVPCLSMEISVNGNMISPESIFLCEKAQNFFLLAKKLFPCNSLSGRGMFLRNPYIFFRAEKILKRFFLL
jgi:hypothetical protein